MEAFLGAIPLSFLRLGLSGKCLIVPPIAEKTAPALLKSQWQFAKKALTECDRLVVFGFSFSEQDAAIRKFLSKSVSAKSKIVLVDIADFRKNLRVLFEKQVLEFVDSRSEDLVDTILKAIA
jgi:hypothetical protein